MVVDNATDGQLGLLAAGLDVLSRGLTALGGARSRGLGRVELHLDQVEELTAKGILTGQVPTYTTWDAVRSRGQAALQQLI
jgi:CRISPR/Cas system CSM-associated protein Csm3 (group 7 of RAMP superfamily)